MKLKNFQTKMLTAICVQVFRSSQAVADFHRFLCELRECEMFVYRDRRRKSRFLNKSDTILCTLLYFHR